MWSHGALSFGSHRSQPGIGFQILGHCTLGRDLGREVPEPGGRKSLRLSLKSKAVQSITGLGPIGKLVLFRTDSFKKVFAYPTLRTCVGSS